MHPVAPRITVPDSLVGEVRELFETNRHLEALARTRDHPLHRWPWGEPAVLAARVISWLGGDRAGAQLHLLNLRHAPWHDEAQLFYLFRLRDSAGILKSLEETERLLREHAFAENHDIRYDVLGHRALLLAEFRDSERALAAINEALSALPDRPWFPAIKAAVLAAADRREEALEWADRALALRPGYRLAVLRKAETLVQLGRSAEAVVVLEEQLAATEVAAYAALLQAIHSEREDVPAALAALDEWRRRQPLLEKKGLGFYHGRRADLLLLQGDLAGAREAAALAGSRFHAALAQRLAEPGAADRRRVRLPVPFVRQNHFTCAPATLASLAAYWKLPADHLEIADEICYDGTPYYHQRTWALRNGFAVVEFSVSYPVAKALVDQGVPFVIATVEPTSAHTQAFAGYDDRACVAIMRDPTSNHFTEAFADLFFVRYGATGPRGMVIVPADQAARLDSLELPDRDAFDRLFALAGALEHHRRDEAGRVFDEMEQSFPGGRVTELARLSLAGYDGDPRREEAAAARLHEMFPADQWARLAYYRLHVRSATHAESLALLDRFCQQEDASPVFELQRALLLAADGRQLDRTEKSFRRFLRMAPQDLSGLSGLADTLAARNRHAAALEIWRLAATVDDTNETMAGRYFTACLRLNRAEEGLAFLRARFTTYGAKSSAPAIALFQAYEALERRDEGFRALDQALALRPEDGTLRLFLAEAYGAVGITAEARAALEAARPRVSRQQWLRCAASFATRIEDNAAARTHWENLLGLAQLDINAMRAVVGLTAEIDGPEAALARLEALAAEHPDFHPLLELRYDWYLREGKTAEAETALRGIIAAFPLSDWAHRALAHVLSLRGEHEAALAAARRGAELAPNLTFAHGQIGEVLLGRRQFEQARAAFRRSLELSIDNAASMRGLLEAAPDAAVRADAVAFLRKQLAAQVTNGAGIRALRDLARPHIEPADLLAVLIAARKARPDLVDTWTAHARELIDRGDFDAARAEVAAMFGQFPYAPDAHLLRAVVEQRAGRLDAAEAAWREALRVVPGWTYAMRGLGETLEGLGRLDDAEAVYRRATAHSPLEAANHGMLADLLWRTNRRAEALAAVRSAVHADPAYDWGWAKLQEWGAALGDKDAALDAARELTVRRAGEPRSWCILSEMASSGGDLELGLSALEQGLRVSPEHVPLWDCKVMILRRRGDLVGALAACDPPGFHGKPPRELRGRRAWLLMEVGQPAAAASELDALLKEQPDYAFARSLRYDLHLRDEEYAKARHHAEQLARIQPSDPTTHGRVAETWLRAGEPAAAVPALRRALNIDLSFGFALRHLLAHALAMSDGAEAGRLVAHAHRFCDPAFALRCEIVAHAGLRQPPKLAESFGRFLTTEGISGEIADEVVATAMASNPKATRRALDQAVKHGTIRSGALVRAWAWHSPAMPGRLAARLRSSQLAPELARDGWDTLLHKLTADSISGFLRWYRRHYQSDGLWAAAGIRFAALGLRAKAARWFATWESRPDLEPWMLIEAIHAVEAVSGPIAAAPIRRRLLATGVAFPDRYLHGIGMAWSEAREGNAQAALALLEGFDPATILAYYQAVYHFTHILLAVLPDGPPGTERADLIGRHWASAVSICDRHPADHGLRWFKRLTAQHAAAAAPEAAFLKPFAARGLAGLLWRWFR